MPARPESLMLCAALACSACGGDELLNPVATRTELVGAVNPLLGTGGVGFGIGSAYPGPALPFAMIHPGPDTSEPGGAPSFYHCSGYYYEDTLIEGFSLLRMHGTGVPDYGTIALMPTDGMSDAKRSEEGYRAGFDHADEVAEPGYYRVRLEGGIEVEITSTRRAAAFRFLFPEGVDPVVLLDAEHTIGDATSTAGSVQIDPAARALDASMHNMGDLSGRFGGFDVYARVVFDVEPVEMGVWDESGLASGQLDASGIDVGGWARFAAGTREVNARVAVSLVDSDGAAGNLEAELPSFDFDGVREAAAAVWNEQLSHLEVWGADPSQATALATALYHAELMPTLMSDVDGRHRDALGAIAQGEGTEGEGSGAERFSDFSLWDTYRTLHPWLLLAEHPLNASFAASLVAMGREGGAVPRWALAHGDVHSMIGSPGEIVLAETAAKGVSFDDELAAYQVARVAAFGPSPGPVGGRSAAEDYLAHGYVPADRHGGSVSRTQEYAIADAALGAWARRLGQMDDAAQLEARGSSYRALYDPEVGFFRGKMSDGSWDAWAGELSGEGPYTEGDAWQYLWLAPHDPEGLAQTLGGREAALGRLRSFFEQSAAEEAFLGHRQYYWHGNEPGLHTPWLFAMWGEPSEAARWIRWAAASFYGTGPDGLAGNDDAGTLSAWLLFASMGIYPVAGFDRYVVAAPLYPKVVLHRPSGDLVIEAEPDPRIHREVSRVTLDGAPLDGSVVSHQQLVGEHLLRFEMR